MSDGEDSTSGEPSAKKKRVDGRIFVLISAQILVVYVNLQIKISQ